MNWVLSWGPQLDKIFTRCETAGVRFPTLGAANHGFPVS